MLEEAFKGAAQNLNSTTIGSVLILVIVVFGLTVRVLRQDLKDAQKELKEEREAHQNTREAQLQDIRNLNHVANSLDGLQAALNRMEDRMVDTAIRRGRQ